MLHSVWDTMGRRPADDSYNNNDRPPWTASPECSTRTFNYVLLRAAAVETTSRDNGRTNGAATFSFSSKKQQQQPQQQPRLLPLAAERVLRYMLREGVARPAMRPNAVTLNAVLSTFCHTQSSGGGSSSSSSVTPTTTTGNDGDTTATVAVARGKFASQQQQHASSQSQQQQHAAATAAVHLLAEWQELYRRGVVTEDADLVSHNTVLSACAKARRPDLAERVFAQLSVSPQQQQIQPDIISYNCLLNAYAIAGMVEKVGALFRTMRAEGGPIAPTIHSYNDVLYAYSKSNRPAQAAEFLNWWLLSSADQAASDQEHEHAVVRPVTHSYNIVLHAMAQQVGPISKSSDAAADAAAVVRRRAQQLFRTMPGRDAISYTTMVALLCKTLSGLEALEAVNVLLQQAYEDPSSVRVDAAFLSNVLYSVAKVVVVDDKKATMPHFAEKIVKDYCGRAAAVSADNNNEDNVVAAAPQRPDVGLYNGLIHCWAKSNSRETGERVLEILNMLEADPSVCPDAKTYTNVIDALKNSRGYPEYLTAAEDILTNMEAAGPAPTVQTYTALIMIYARSRLSCKAVKAASVLSRMKQAGIRPNLISYNAVLNACEHTDSSDRVATEEGLKVACLTFDELKRQLLLPSQQSSSSVKANHVTYGSFLGTLGNLMPPDTRQEIVGLVFRRCCLEGQASPLVLKKLRGAAVTEERYRSLLEGHDEKKLPASWTCHVRDSPARLLQ